MVADKKQPKKQRHSARRVFNRLVAEHGYAGGESTVRRYVRIAKAFLGIDTAVVPRYYLISQNITQPIKLCFY